MPMGIYAVTASEGFDEYEEKWTTRVKAHDEDHAIERFYDSLVGDERGVHVVEVRRVKAS